MKSIYDEAIKSLSNICKDIREKFNFPLSLTADYRTITDTLERAKKVEELLDKIQNILALNLSYSEIGIRIERLMRERY